VRLPSDGRARVVIEDVAPIVDDGRFPVKCTIGERINVEAAIFADGHDSISCVVLHRLADETKWHSVPMTPLGNDMWRAEFPVSQLGRYLYTIEGWIDHFKTWRADLKKRIAAAQDLSTDLIIGSQFIAQASTRASGDDAKRLKTWATAVASGDIDTAQSGELFATMQAWPDLSLATRYERELTLWVEPPKARFSTWYEFFPRSTSPDPQGHGSFKDCAAWLSHIADMGFDVVYLPPIHPIGKQFRKGKNNTPGAQPGDPGSPWAIGAETGGTQLCIRNWERSTISGCFSRKRRGCISKSRSTLLFNVHRTIRGSMNTRNGSASGRMARFNTQKIPPKNIRTFILSILKL